MYEAAPIRTARLALRPLTMGDSDDVFAYSSDAETLRYMFWPARDRAESTAALARRTTLTKLAADGDRLSLAIELVDSPDATNRVIGEVNIRLTSVSSAQAEVGWILNPAYQGRGFAQEAAESMIRLCFETLGSHRVHAELVAGNAASVALCRRLGMREEALLVEDVLLKGEWVDTGVYALLEREWRGRGSGEGTRPGAGTGTGTDTDTDDQSMPSATT